MQLYGWDPENGAWDAEFDDISAVEWTAHDRPTPVCSPVFKHVAFGKQPLPSWYTDLHDVYMRNDRPTMLGRNRKTLADHLVAARSLATFPAVKRMWFHSSVYGMIPDSIYGVTVWDVVRTIHSRCVFLPSSYTVSV